MQQHRIKDRIAGSSLLLAGTGFAGYAASQLRLGSFAEMGPGMFPFLIGAILALLGAAVLTLALLDGTGEPVADDLTPPEPIEWRSLVVVIAAMTAFTLVITWFGMLPAIFAMCLVAARASDKLTAPVTLAVAAGLSAAAWLIFIEVLGLNFRILAWPF